MAMSAKRLVPHLLTVVVIACAVALGSLSEFFAYLWGESPNQPNQATEQVVREFWKGRVLYVRAWEDLYYNRALRVFFALWAAGLICGLIYWAYHWLRYGEQPDWPAWGIRALIAVLMATIVGWIVVGVYFDLAAP